VSDPPSWLTPAELDAMTAYLTARPEIRKVGRYEFTIDGRRADFAPAVLPAGQAYPIS
jgi:alpha-galactosidase